MGDVSAEAEPDSTGPSRSPEMSSRLFYLGLFGAFVMAGLLLYAGALNGPFITDDFNVILGNPEIHEFSVGNAAAILDPGGLPAARTTNYAPAHLFLHAAEWRFFGEQTWGYHIVNVVLHGLASVLIVALFVRAGLRREGALLGGVLFLVHPANVETVAWIFQLKTIASTALAVAALLLRRRRPGLAATLFGLALLTKITALFALPAAVVETWLRTERDGSSRRDFGWIGVWAGIALGIGFAELGAFRGTGSFGADYPDDLALHVRTMVAIGMRYLVMAATSYGVSSSHEPPAATSLLDPWWLAGLVCLGLLGWRLVVCLRGRDPEAVFWIMAAAAYAPVCQIFPFRFPMADRYLYPILPGLIGATLLAARPLLDGRGSSNPLTRRLAWGLGALAVVGFAAHTATRAPVFRSGISVVLDAAAHYPDGMQGSLLTATRAARRGDVQATARALRRLYDLGSSDFRGVIGDPAFAPLLGHPEILTVVQDMAGRRIEQIETLERVTPGTLLTLGAAHAIRQEKAAALSALDRALELEEAADPNTLEQIHFLRAQLVEAERTAPPH